MLDFLAMISDQMRAGFPGLVDASHWDVVEPCMGTYVMLTNSARRPSTSTSTGSSSATSSTSPGPRSSVRPTAGRS